MQLAIIALAALLLGAPALAAPINYGDFNGSTVNYLQVTEDALSAGDSPPLFGPPTVTGDSIDFDPVGFKATSANGVGADITDGNLKFMIKAKGNAAISSIKFAEAGDVTLVGFGSDATFASVSTHLFIDVVEVDGIPISVVSLNNVSIPFAPSGGTYGLASDGGGGPLYTSAWAGNVVINVNAILTSHGIPFARGATKVKVNLDNTLAALSQPNTSSLIAKKNANGVVITVNLPEPTAGLMATFAGRVDRSPPDPLKG